MAVINMLVKHLDVQELKGLERQFRKIDYNNTGYIELENLERAMKKCSIPVNDQQIR